MRSRVRTLLRDGTQLGRFGAALVRHAGKGAAAKAIALQTLGSLTEGVSILLLIPILSFVDASQGSRASFVVPDLWFLPSLGGTRLGLPVVLAALVTVLAFLAVFNRYRTIFVADLFQSFMNSVRRDIFEALTYARWSFVSRHREADLNHVLTAETERLQALLVSLFAVVQIAIMQVVYLAISFLVSPAMTTFAAVIGLLVLVGLHPLRRRARTFGMYLSDNRRGQYRTVSDFLGGMKLAKSLNAEDFYVGRLTATLERMKEDNNRFNRVATFANMGFDIALATTAAIFILIAVDQAALPLPHMVVLLLVFMRLAPRFMDMQILLQQVATTLPAFQAIETLRAELANEREAETAARSFSRLRESIVFQDVSFRYPDATQTPAVAGMSVTISAGTITALIGPSGAGKSTMIDLVIGLAEPEGRILVDGVPLTNLNRRAWRNNIAYVPQDVFLLHNTVSENLRLSKADASLEQMREALRVAEALSFVDSLPDGIETIVGDRGARLSGGERQRLALARALLREPDLLVIDEATSALDHENQKRIAMAISNMKNRLTILMIAHQPSIVAVADFVLAVEDGRLVESGSYQKLIVDPDTRLSQLMRSEPHTTRVVR